jgi:hypothetical protein
VVGWGLPQWFVNGLLLAILAAIFLLLYWVANRILGGELSHLVSIIKQEWDDSRSRKVSVGSINWRGFIGLLLFGFVVIVSMSAQKVVGLVGSVMGIEHAKELAHYSNFLTLFYVAALWLFFSVTMVVFDNKNGRGRK